MQLSGFNAEQILQRQTLSLCEQANPLMANGDFLNALKLFDMALALYSQIQNLQYARAFCLFQLQRFTEAKIAIEEELKIQPSSEESLHLLNNIMNIQKDHISNIEIDGESQIIQYFINSNNVVFDVGANVGLWTQEVLKYHPDVTVHLFEPVTQVYHSLLKNLSHSLETNQLFPNNVALSRNLGVQYFTFYEDNSTLSSFYRRNSNVERLVKVQPPTTLPVFTTTLDNYCKSKKITHIHFLKIDVEGGELDVLYSGKNLLERNSIDYIQFEYGGTYQDAGITLKQVFEFLTTFNYGIFKIQPQSLEYKAIFSMEDENYEYANYLAVSGRLLSNVLKQPPQMLDIQKLCDKYNIQPLGIIHIGAHEGGEIKIYEQMGVEKVVFIEANPLVFKRLNTNLSNVSSSIQINTFNYAISNENTNVTLHITSADMSSSILPLKLHSEIYPTIKETTQIVVPAKKLDTLLQEQNLNPLDFNILNIDIQGAELLALQGASNLLNNIDAVYTEINYEELYEGCALIHQIDDFLDSYGFKRVATITPYHPSWGDAFYIKKPLVTMSSLGQNGRFANQLFQYAFLKIYAKKYDLRVETPQWIGQYLFGHDDPSISFRLPEKRILLDADKTDGMYTNLATSLIEDFCSPPYENIDFWGYFQFHTKYYLPHKDYFISLFKPTSQVEENLQLVIQKLKTRGKTLVGLHLRRGDYEHYTNGLFYAAPTQWYKTWLEGFWETLEEPVLFIASDEPHKVINDFMEYNPVTIQSLDLPIPTDFYFYVDFYVLTQCNVVAISNSSFSFLASMLNEKATIFVRPHLVSQKLIPFEPWNSEVLLQNTTTEFN